MLRIVLQLSMIGIVMIKKKRGPWKYGAQDLQLLLKNKHYT